MRDYKNAAAFRQALEDRIARSAAAEQQRVFRQVVIARLLARLAAVNDRENSVILKGGSALEIRIGNSARTTSDVDFDALDREAAGAILQRAVDVDLGDDFSFRILARDGDIQTDVSRFALVCEVSGRTLGPSTLNVDIGKSTGPSTIEMVGIPNYLGFAGAEPIEYPTLAVEDHYSEKLHAVTRMYGIRQNSRAKDLFDSVLIQNELALNRNRLIAGISRTFEIRNTHPIPRTLPVFPAEWANPIAKLGRDYGTHRLTLADAQRIVEELLNPILAEIHPR